MIINRNTAFSFFHIYVCVAHICYSLYPMKLKRKKKNAILNKKFKKYYW